LTEANAAGDDLDMLIHSDPTHTLSPPSNPLSSTLPPPHLARHLQLAPSDGTQCSVRTDSAAPCVAQVRTRRQVVSIAQPDKAPTDGGQFTITVKHWEPPEYHPSAHIVHALSTAFGAVFSL
jgi:hypothetical protein